MISIYEYLVQHSDDLKQFSHTKNDRFWIYAIDPVTISGGFDISLDGENWESHYSGDKFTLDSNQYAYLHTTGFANKLTYQGRFNVGGDIIGLVKKDIRDNNLRDGILQYAFNDMSVVNAADLNLSNVIMTPSCFYRMFAGCKELLVAPELPSMDVKKKCYYGMFQDCSKLVEAPELPALKMDRECYSGMFRCCESLKKAPKLPAMKLSPYCYQGMFFNCISLQDMPELPATRLSMGSYSYMFENCRQIKKAVLPATIIVRNCYDSIFNDCKSLHDITIMVKEVDDWEKYGMSWISANTGVIHKYDSLNITRIPKGWTIKSL